MSILYEEGRKIKRTLSRILVLSILFIPVCGGAPVYAEDSLEVAAECARHELGTFGVSVCVNGNGMVSFADVVYMKRYLVGNLMPNK